MYDLDYEEVRQNLILISGDDVDLRLVHAEGRTPIRNDAVYQQLVELASDPEVGLVVLDPLVDVHNVDEGDNVHMNFVMRVLQRLSKEANVATLILHHTTKGGSTRQEERVGNMEIARGASGIVYKARIAFTLMNATQKDCEDYGLQDKERNTWVRMDDAKSQFVLASPEAYAWFRKEGVKIPSGDIVGVLRATELKHNTTNIRIRIGDILIGAMVANGQGSMPIGQAVSLLKAEEPLYANKTDTEVKKRLEGLFTVAVEVRGHTLQVTRDGEGTRSNLLVVLR